MSSGLIIPNRWLAFFDILGFSDMVVNAREPREHARVLAHCRKALAVLQNELQNVPHIRTGYFSDSFIVYSSDDSGNSYAWLQSKAKNFVRRCLYEGIPFRGAISFGEFYVNEGERIYFGKALIEAIREEQAQDWIGLVLTKSAEVRLQEFDPPLRPEGHHFIRVVIPTSKQAIPKDPNRIRPAYTFRADTAIPALEAMRLLAPDHAKQKYTNAIEHIRRAQLPPPSVSSGTS